MKVEETQKYDKKIDADNIKIFSIYGINESSEKRYKCCLCKRPVSIDGSYSKKGHKLVCIGCLYDLFDGSVEKMFEYIEGE